MSDNEKKLKKIEDEIRERAMELLADIGITETENRLGIPKNILADWYRLEKIKDYSRDINDDDFVVCYYKSVGPFMLCDREGSITYDYIVDPLTGVHRKAETERAEDGYLYYCDDEDSYAGEDYYKLNIELYTLIEYHLDSLDCSDSPYLNEILYWTKFMVNFINNVIPEAAHKIVILYDENYWWIISEDNNILIEIVSKFRTMYLNAMLFKSLTNQIDYIEYLIKMENI